MTSSSNNDLNIENIEMIQEDHMRQVTQSFTTRTDNNEGNQDYYDNTTTDGGTASFQLMDGLESGAGVDSGKSKAPIAAEETRVVKRLRAGLVFVLLVFATGFCTGTYLFVSEATSKNYKLSFEKLADSIEGSVATNIQNLESALTNLGDAIASYATPQGKQSSSALTPGRFPFVHVDKFETHGYHARDRSKMESIVYAPLVTAGQVKPWEQYSFAEQGWIQESRQSYTDHLPVGREPPVYIPGDISSYIYRRRDEIFAEPSVIANDTQLYMPLWYMSPPPMNPAVVNLDIMSRPEYYALIQRTLASRSSVLSPFVDNIEAMLSLQVSDADHLRYHQEFSRIDVNEENTGVGYNQPHSLYAQPVFEGPGSQEIVGILLGITYLATLLPDGVNSVFCVVRSRCGGIERGYTYELKGDRPVFRGEGVNYHPAAYAHLKRQVPFFNAGSFDGDDEDDCSYNLEIYPSLEFVSSYDSPVNIIATITVAATFAAVALVFSVYDFVINARNRKVEETAARSQAVVSSLFPEQVRDRLMDQKDRKQRKQRRRGTNDDPSGSDDKSDDGNKVIADFYPATTILFADIVGFTAWSSAREPAQVFVLLETLFSSFDKLAKRRRVYKTVGDCYVAACGVPKPRSNHAVVMARFANELNGRANKLISTLERSLGPGTGNLSMRIGLHSGPIVAGVLRGDNARFQLFGDTMNTTSRVESTGMANKIHISQETANLLLAAGKERWITKRVNAIVAKGKGELQTYWLHVDGGSTDSVVGSEDIAASESSSHDSFQLSDNSDSIEKVTTETKRCVEWNSSLILGKLEKVIEQRNAEQPDELQTVITKEITNQIGAYVKAIAVRYHDNYFHNHVAMNVVKMLSRIVIQDERSENKYANAIAADSMLQLAAIFSALIHDVDHLGIPNSRLQLEQPALAAKYRNQSIAENNSLEIAWSLFLQPKFAALRKCIAPSDEELAKFRETVVHATLATDLMDKDLKADRNLRWAKAFSEEASTCNDSDKLKVRIVIEHLIQASDVIHTMQHWHIYRKWNEQLFREMHKAWRDGRASTSPEETWYGGEISFFDHYILPLTKKLADCKVFGVSSDEYWNYASNNAARWEREGQEIVKSMVAACENDASEGEDESSEGEDDSFQEGT